MKRRIIVTFTKFSTYWLGFFFAVCGLWVNRKFGEPSFEQVIFHLQFGAEGLRDADPALLDSFLKNCILYPIFAATFVYFLEYIVVGVKRYGYEQFFRLAKTAVLKGLMVVRDTLERITFWLFSKRVPVIMLFVGAAILLTKLSFWSYALQARHSGFADDMYVQPVLDPGPENKRNLLLVYVESLESTYSHPKNFGRNLLEGLDAVTQDWISFGRYTQLYGTGWTMAGIVSTQCGIPLRPYSWFDKSEEDGRLDGNELGEKRPNFLPGAVCLGDVLKAAGYVNVFYGGADENFAGKGKFLRAHGYDVVLGRDGWVNRGEKDFGGWGLYDDRLLEQAKWMIDDLQSKGKPFNMTVLTVDTHHPSGFLSPTCRGQGVGDFPGIVECSAKNVAQLIKHVQERGYLENTDVVIMGDHLSMVNTHYEVLQRAGDRYIYNAFYSKGGLKKNREVIYHFDVFPTILTMLGFAVPDGKAALGVSGLGAVPPNQGLHGGLSNQELNSRLGAPSRIYTRLWEGK